MLSAEQVRKIANSREADDTPINNLMAYIEAAAYQGKTYLMYPRDPEWDLSDEDLDKIQELGYEIYLSGDQDYWEVTWN